MPKLLEWIQNCAHLTVLAMGRVPRSAHDHVNGRLRFYAYESNEIPRSLGISTTPSAILVSPDGRSLSAVLRGRDVIERFVEEYERAEDERTTKPLFLARETGV